MAACVYMQIREGVWLIRKFVYKKLLRAQFRILPNLSIFNIFYFIWQFCLFVCLYIFIYFLYLFNSNLEFSSTSDKVSKTCISYCGVTKNHTVFHQKPYSISPHLRVVTNPTMWKSIILLYTIECFIDVSATNKINNFRCSTIYSHHTCWLLWHPLKFAILFLWANGAIYLGYLW